MGISKQYRTSQDFKEVLRILQRSTSLPDNILWQSFETNKNIIPIDHFEIDFVTRGVVVFYKSADFKLNPRLPFFVKLDYKTTVFKVVDYNIQKHCIHFSFPSSVKTLELRSDPRHIVPPQLHRNVNLRPAVVSDSSAQQEIEAKVFDLSTRGVGLVVSENAYYFFKKNRILWLTHLGSARLEEPLLSEVRYINNDLDLNFQKSKPTYLKVGLHLSSALPKENILTFISQDR